MAVLDQNKNHISWQTDFSQVAHGDLGMRVLKGSMLVLAGMIGLVAAIALDPAFNLFS